MTATTESQSKDDNQGLTIDWKRGLIPLSLLTLIILYYYFHAPFWVLAVFCLWIPIFYIGVPLYTQKKWESFEATFARRFQRGEHKQLLEDYRDQWYLRRFGPRELMLSKLGLIYSAMEKYAEAEYAFEEAIEATEGRIPEKLHFNLANAKFEQGKSDEAMRIYLTLKGNSPYQGAAKARMALIDLERDHRTEQALEHLRDNRHTVSGSLKKRIDRALARHSP